MDKAAVKQYVEKVKLDVVEALEQAVQRDTNSADIDETETKDPEDFSHQQELNQMGRTLQIRLDRARNEASYVSGLSEEAMDTVGEGALVETDHLIFYISVPVNQFEIDGRTIVGISVQAPIYAAMRDKKAGESFMFNGKEFNVKSVG